MKKLILFLSVVVLLVSCGRHQTRGFAIVVDPESYAQAQTEIDQYQQVVESRGLKPVLVIDRWGVPDSIRACLMSLYQDKRNPIEGCVFIGDIPVAKVRDAQFLTSAFKMDQGGRFPMSEYCVSTDRYYDSFDLEWDFICRDSARSEYFYYTLRSDCQQKLRPSIYSARIFPRTNQLGEKYEKLRRYMRRVNEAAGRENKLDQVFYFGGHGNVSDSYDARMDEKVEMYDQMPWLKKGGSLKFLDFRRDNVVKPRLMNELRRGELDYALLHHHGSEEEQLLSGYPVTSSLPTSLDNARRYVRSLARSGKRRGRSFEDIKASAASYLRSEVPVSWIKEAEDPEIMAKDQAADYAQDLHVAEFKDFAPQVFLVSLDACYNGSFHMDESIQEAYLFGPGSGTLLALANTVNSIQDRWINRYSGMIGLGMRVGYLAMLNVTLETHLFGDPTYCFTPSGDCGFDVNAAMNNTSPRFWRKQLDNCYPAVQALAVYELAERCEGNYSDLLMDIFKSSPYGMVRLAALLELTNYRDDNLTAAVAAGMDDNYELLQRFAVILSGRIGEGCLVEPLMRLYCQNTLPERVEFDLGANALRCYDSALLLPAFRKALAETDCYRNPDSIAAVKEESLTYYSTSMSEDFRQTAFDRSLTVKARLSDILSLRNYNVHSLVPEMLDYLSEPSDDVQIQQAMWETLGWFDLSYQAPGIAAKAQSVMNDSRFDVCVRKEAEKTWNRVK